MSDDLWAKLQEPFGTDDIELLPRATGDKDKRTKRKCDECGGYHEFPCIHLSYVGHAGITMRLNAVDPEWTWEPMAKDERGMPVFDTSGGLWAYLTVLGVTKPAYGDPGLDWKGQSKMNSPDGMKEAIGDMLRNGAMRFGVGTQLWSKSDRAKNDLVRASENTDDTPATDPPLTEQQMKKLWATAKELGMDDDTLHRAVKRDTGKEHVDLLTKREASALIDKMTTAVKKSTE